jgi:hypothetical protein
MTLIQYLHDATAQARRLAAVIGVWQAQLGQLGLDLRRRDLAAATHFALAFQLDLAAAGEIETGAQRRRDAGREPAKGQAQQAQPAGQARSPPGEQAVTADSKA